MLQLYVRLEGGEAFAPGMDLDFSEQLPDIHEEEDDFLAPRGKAYTSEIDEHSILNAHDEEL